MGAQSSKPAVQESFADEKARMDSPPAYSTDVDVREDHGEDRAMGEGLMVDDLKVWNKSFEAVCLSQHASLQPGAGQW